METKKPVVIKLKGGMGNQMFQYAFGRALERAAEKAGQPIAISFDITAYTNPLKADTRRPFMLEPLNVQAVLASDEVSLKAYNPYGIISKVLRRILGTGNTVAFDPSLLLPPFKKSYEGYWQTEKYFADFTDQIRSEFTLNVPLGSLAQSMYERIKGDDHSVSIFYRRTDYVGHKTFDIGEQDYQKRALARMKELVPNMKLYVMSDDITWVKENVDLPEGSVFVSDKEITPQEEMHLASACRHHIIPNSTFAWWGAYLNKNPNKVVITPKVWANVDNDEYADIVPAGWLRV